MMPEISLHILDVAENSVRAGARNVVIRVAADTAADLLSVSIEDDGKGMDREQVARVADPFYTSRKTRRVGLGVPFFKLAAELTGGHFSIRSAPGEGTTVCADFVLSSVDRMPLGDMPSTMHTLITMHEDIDFQYQFTLDGAGFALATAEFREILGEVSFREPEVSQYILDYLRENTADTLGDHTI